MPARHGSVGPVRHRGAAAVKARVVDRVRVADRARVVHSARAARQRRHPRPPLVRVDSGPPLRGRKPHRLRGRKPRRPVSSPAAARYSVGRHLEWNSLERNSLRRSRLLRHQRQGRVDLRRVAKPVKSRTRDSVGQRHASSKYRPQLRLPTRRWARPSARRRRRTSALRSRGVIRPPTNRPRRVQFRAVRCSRHRARARRAAPTSSVS